MAVRAHNSDPGPKVGRAAIIVSSVVLVLVGVALVQSLVELWPAVDSATQTRATGVLAPDHEISLFFGLIQFMSSASTSLIVLAFTAGALGAFIAVATSFATYVGNGTLRWRWMLWYAVRLIIGSVLGTVFYFLIRGGFFSTDSLSADINPYGIAGISALVGMLSKQATDKLTNVFETLFGLKQSKGDQDRMSKATVQ